MKKISVVVPVCNVEKYLVECLESLIHQTLEDIEIICVDDASTDHSADILHEYEKKDARIKAVYHETNLSTSQARKDAVKLSTGKYLMFVDGDDSLALNACETAYEAIEKYQTDMLQFDTEILNYGGVPEKRIESNQKLLTPCLEKLENADLILQCWQEKKIRFTLWNKIYRGDLARKSFELIKDGSYPKAQDLYAFFVMAYHMHSYMGIEDKLYKYKFGTGVIGQNEMELAQYDTLLTERRVWEAIEEFVREQKVQDIYEEVVQQIKTNFLTECILRWMNNLELEEIERGFQHLINTWGYEETICGWAGACWFNRAKVAEKLENLKIFSRTDYTEPKTIAYYYRSIKNGGAQRVAAMLANIFAEIKDESGLEKYKVVLITDEEEEGDDTLEYSLHSGVKREYLPAFGTYFGKDYRARFDTWNRIIEDDKIDVLINGMWCAPCAVWDMISIKGTKRKPMYLTHMHSFCCVPYGFEGEDAEELIHRYRLSDGVVTLSECDARFVSAFNPHAKSIVNPLTFDIKTTIDYEKKGNTILWVGRISDEKQPLDAVHMMRRVVKEVPDARLIIVGSGDKELEERMQSLISLYELQDHVVMAVYTLDVEKYYKEAAVYIGTSSYEGFSLTYAEAMAYGIPVVAYDMPWLTIIRDGRGILTVGQGRAESLAKKVIALLKDEEKRQQLGREGRCQCQELNAVDIGVEWISLIDDIWQKKEENVSERDYEHILFEYMTKFQQNGKLKGTNAIKEKLTRTYAEKSEINRKLQITYGEKRERGIIIREQKEEIKQLKKQLKIAQENKIVRVLKKIYRKVKKGVRKICK